MKFILILCVLLCAPVYAQQPTCTPLAPPPVIHWRNAITIEEVKDYLSHSHNLREWNRSVAKIIELNSGKLPRFWQHEIIDSQYFDGVRRSWGHGLAQEP